MNYNLALELKKAGFSQKGLKTYVTNGIDDDAVHVPTLSELIKACGTDNIHGEFTLFYDLKEWVAGYYEDDWGEPRKHNQTERGSTPEIAVAKLWLLLNTQDNLK